MGIIKQLLDLKQKITQVYNEDILAIDRVINLIGTYKMDQRLVEDQFHLPKTKQIENIIKEFPDGQEFTIRDFCYSFKIYPNSTHLKKLIKKGLLILVNQGGVTGNKRSIYRKVSPEGKQCTNEIGNI